ncbi:Protein ecdysoneless -like protein [Sarcoptes scabiei]|uniref:Protein ecdysoneless -like protein n=1 Tax=Sarcoptes scabiei TaxID=52283 RepID=A0A834VAB1_SARSC|nr:Protein ecdysoneless -like protein [Sarcoptes scabiei]
MDDHRIVSLNTVRYFLYPKLEEDQSIEEQLKTLIINYNNFLQPYLKDYIWQNECLNFHYRINQRLSYIYGSSDFGEFIEDEWFIVFLLKKLTTFDNELAIRVVDEDGEFLLIESSPYLKTWENDPKYTVNRVFLFKDSVHLVSPKYVRYQDSLINFIAEQIDFLRKNHSKTKRSDSVQSCVSKRLTQFDDKHISSLNHKAHCFLPIRIVAILNSNPNLITSAVRAFYYRTPEDKSIIKSMRNFSTDKWIIANIRFNHCSYAQLVMDDGKNIAFKFQNENIDSQSSKKAVMIGTKIVAGFEILIENYKKNHSVNDQSKMKSTFESNQFENGKKVHNLLKALDLKDLELYENACLDKEDDEDWLRIDPANFDSFLAESFHTEEKELSKKFRDFISEQCFDDQYLRSDIFESEDEFDIEEKIKNIQSDQSDSTNDEESSVLNEESIKEFSLLKSYLNENYNADEEEVSDDENNDNNRNQTDLNEKVTKKSHDSMIDYMREMDAEISEKLIEDDGLKVGLDSDDSEYDHTVDEYVCSNLVKSIEGELQMLEGIGPTSSLLSMMKDHNLQEKL